MQFACKSELADEVASLKAKLGSKLEDGDMRVLMDRQKHALQVRQPPTRVAMSCCCIA